MKKFILLPFLVLTLTHAWALETIEPTQHASRYLVVGVSGFKTGRDKNDSENIYSNKIGKDSEDSGVWTNINTNHPKIVKTVYLSHYSKDSELDSVMKLVVDQNNNCIKDQGLIMMVNSWGAKISQRLAQRYLKKCGILPHLTILIDGVSKPTPFAYDKSILSLNCVNFYQHSSKLQGNSIENCSNTELQYNDAKNDLFYAHIHAEWDASAKGKIIIENYLDGKLPVMFLRDDYNIDYRAGL